MVIDALGLDKVTAEVMPRLHSLGSAGAIAEGRGVLPAITYPNHATFVTGAGPEVHGLYANEVLRDRAWVGAQEVGPSAPTIFDELDAMGLTSVGVFGDHNLAGVCGAPAATRHWPPDGVAPPDVAKGPTGYTADQATLEAALDLEPSLADFAMVHFDENDGVSHVHGPSSPEAVAQAGRTDSLLGELLDSYRHCWDDTVVVVLSDHCQEDVRPGSAVPVDELLASSELPGLDGDAELRWRGDGTCVLLAPSGISGAVEALERLEAIEAAREMADGTVVAWGSEGVVLGLDWGQRGDHGSERCRPQVAVVGGGHPAAAGLAEAVSTGPNPGSAWFSRTIDLLQGPTCP